MAFGIQRDHLSRQLGDADVVAHVPQVEDLALAAIRRAQNGQHGVAEVAHAREGAALLAPVDERQWLLAQQGRHEAGQDAWNSFAVDPGQVVHARADDVEGTHDGEGQGTVASLGPDPALEQLLGAGVAPALALHRAQHERRGVFLKQGRRIPAAVHLAGGKVYQPATLARAQFDQGKQIEKVRPDHVLRDRVVQRRIAQRGH